MRPWYIGESRAQNLLVYAQGVLAKYAYQLPYQGYLEVWNVLQSTIPLWVEERRGPRNPQTGQPLSLESDFKKYIDWWVYQLVAVRTGKESKVKASFVNKVFSKDPAGAVFGTRVAASRLRAGVVEEQMASQLDSMFQGVMDAPNQWDQTDVLNTMIAGLETLNGLIAAYGPERATQLAPIKDVLLKWMQVMFSTWITASTEVAPVSDIYPKGFHLGGVPSGGGVFDPNWEKQWKFPTGGYINEAEGPGKAAAIQAKLAEILQYAVRYYASGTQIPQDVQTAWTAQNINFPTVQNLGALGLQAPSMGSLAAPTSSTAPEPAFPRTMAELYTMYGLETKARLALLVASVAASDISTLLDRFEVALIGTGRTFNTGKGGALNASEVSAFVSLVKSTFQSATGKPWGDIPSVI
jgi:hypothetical protein